MWDGNVAKCLRKDTIKRRRLGVASQLEPRAVTWGWDGLRLTFPGASTAPPITTTSLTLKNVSGSLAAAIARLVKGPTATMVMVSGSLSLNSLSISRHEGSNEGVNSECSSLTR